VKRKACYLALGVAMDGERDVLGMWFQEAEGAKFWMQVLSELKQRGVRDILICCVDGLAGFPEAIEAIFPDTVVQTCIVHLIRQSLRYVPRKQYDEVVKDLRPIYTAIDANAAGEALEAFDQRWGKQLPVITKAWRDAWEYVIPFLAFPEEVRRVIYTTDENVKGGTLISRSRGACGGAGSLREGVARRQGGRRNRVRMGRRRAMRREGTSPLRGASRTDCSWR
jgi:putative transposase